MKAILTIVAVISFVMMFCTSESLVAQCFISLGSITLFVGSCKLYEKYYLTNDEEERV